MAGAAQEAACCPAFWVTRRGPSGFASAPLTPSPVVSAASHPVLFPGVGEAGADRQGLRKAVLHNSEERRLACHVNRNQMRTVSEAVRPLLSSLERSRAGKEASRERKTRSPLGRAQAGLWWVSCSSCRVACGGIPCLCDVACPVHAHTTLGWSWSPPGRVPRPLVSPPHC